MIELWGVDRLYIIYIVYGKGVSNIIAAKKIIRNDEVSLKLHLNIYFLFNQNSFVGILFITRDNRRVSTNDDPRMERGLRAASVVSAYWEKKYRYSLGV